MKTPIATTALICALSGPALAQGLFSRGNAGRTAAPAAQPAQPTTATRGAPPVDGQVLRSGSVIPEPLAPDQVGKPTIPLPDGPIEPYLLRKEYGPFMVVAHTFRGPDATKYAMALVNELKAAHRLPACIFYLKIQPGQSNIRNTMPTAPAGGPESDIHGPEFFRTVDEAAVLVGNCKSIDEAESLLKTVKHIKPKCLDGLPTIYGWRRGAGLKQAFVTANPLQGAQNLYPGRGVPTKPGEVFDPFAAAQAVMAQRQTKPDPFLRKINGGPHAITNCPGTYSLEVAEFAGRNSLDMNDVRLTSDTGLKNSPLVAAAENAEHLADSLTKCKRLPAKFRPYVYHDRSSSKVMIGSFSGPNDPDVQELKALLNGVSEELLYYKHTQRPLAPGGAAAPVPRF